MQIKQSTISWGLIFGGLLFFIYLVGDILTPFIFGAFVAYFLDPVADKFEEKGLSRSLSTVLTLSIFCAILAGVIMVFGPLFFDQIGGLIEKIPVYIAQLEQEHGMALRKYLDMVQPGLQDQAKDMAFKFSNELFKISGVLLTGLFTSGAAVFSVISLVLISPIIAFYLLRDWDILVKKIDDLLPREKVSVIRKNFMKIDEIISAYIRGQVSVCIIMAIFYSINLTIVGLNYGFAIGFLTGILSFIPYVGMAIGAITGLTVAYIQFGFGDGMLLVLAVFIFGNVIEGNFVTPKLVGDSVELHPAWIIFALLAGGAVFGFKGILIAIPSAAVIGVLTRSSVEAYKTSGLYLGYDSNTLHINPTGYTAHEGVITEREEAPVFSAFEDLKPQTKPMQEMPKKTKVANNPKPKKNKKKKKKKELEFKFPKPESGF
jgi:predicted PurR-regulated permease PerM